MNSCLLMIRPDWCVKSRTLRGTGCRVRACTHLCPGDHAEALGFAVKVICEGGWSVQKREC